MTGKKIRLARIFNPLSGRTVIAPLDHGMSMGPIQGLEDTRKVFEDIALGGADAVVLHKGSIPGGISDHGNDMGLIIHLSAGSNLSPEPDRKVVVCRVEDALRLGADAVSFHLNICNPFEAEMMRELGEVSGQCLRWGMPLMVMAYARGPEVPHECAPELVAHAARIAAEIGADIVKVSYTGDPDSFMEVTRGCPAPVVIAGGNASRDERAVFMTVRDALEAGARGVSIGRNVFQHRHPEKMVEAISAIVHDDAGIDRALELLR